jgi:arsenate reductase
MINKTYPGKVLFLCTGNSCRSQLAEAIVNSQLSDNWQAYSAGTKPTGYVHPLTTVVLDEIGIQQQGRSKNVSEFFDTDFDLVMTVCDSAQEDCPTWLKLGRQLHLSFPDPAIVTGDQEEVLAAFRKVRDDIAKIIPDILIDYYNNQDNPG